MSDKVKLAEVNELLWKNQVYDKITWRLVQGHIDLGNFAAHGDFDEYDDNKVKDMLDTKDIEFMAKYNTVKHLLNHD